MPIKRSSIKDVRRTERRTTRNRVMRDRLHDVTKKLRKALTGSDSKIVIELATQLQKALDKAAKTHVVHRNAARRKVSRAMRVSRRK